MHNRNEKSVSQRERAAAYVVNWQLVHCYIVPTWKETITFGVTLPANINTVHSASYNSTAIVWHSQLFSTQLQVLHAIHSCN